MKKIYFLRTALFLMTLMVGIGDAISQSSQELDQWQFVKGDLGSIWEAIRPVGPGSPEDVPIWEKINLPHSYNAFDAVDPYENYYQGPAWYKTEIEVENSYQNGRTLLHFEGVGQRAEFYVYEQKVGSHVGGYDEWKIDITEAVQAFLKREESKRFKGKVPIVVRTDNSRDTELIPSDMVDFTLYGGLYRNVNLAYVPPVSLEYVHVLPEVDTKGKRGKVKLKTLLYNPDKIEATTLSLTVFDPSGKQIFSEEQTLTDLKDDWIPLEGFSVKKPKLWSPDAPNLYRLQVELTARDQTFQEEYTFGFRNFEFKKNGPFMLNGERLLLKGTHRHQDWAGVGGAETDEMVAREMKMIKDMGANFIRLGHYQQSKFVLDQADSLGLLVWEEIPWNRGGVGEKDYRSQAKRMLVNMIEQHYNHPSIILWGMGNEMDWPGDFPTYEKDSIRSFLKELNDLSHEYDPSRKTTIRRCDFCKDIIDVYSPSIWAGWYSGVYTEYQEASKQQMERVDHFFHAEWGADAIAGRHAKDPYQNIGGIPAGHGVAEKEGDASLVGGAPRVSRDGDWDETYQADLVDWHLKEQEQMPWLTGAAYWSFKDFATPLRPDNPIPYINSKGTVTRDLKPKEAYFVFQSYWTDELMAHIYGHTWPIRWGDKNEKQLIKVYSNGEKAELFVNGKSAGIKKRNFQDFPAAGLRWEIPMTKGEYQLEVIAHKGKQQVSDSLTFEYRTEKWEKPVRLKLSVVEVKNDLATLKVEALDKHGALALDARNNVHFTIAGDGKLLDNLGTADGAKKVELQNGQAKIRVKLKGKSSVGVSAKGVETDLIELKI